MIKHFGVGHVRRDDMELAIRFLSAAIALCPVHRKPPWINRARHLMIGQVEEALADFETALPMSGGDPG